MRKRLYYWLKFFRIYKNWNEIIYHRLRNTNLTKIKLNNGLSFCSSVKSPLTVIVDEIFLFNRYTIYPEVKIRRDDVVVDIGAHVGIFSIFAFQNGASKVYSYEPDVNNCKYISKNCYENNIKNVYVNNLAITDINGSINLYLNASDGGNSVFLDSQSSNMENTIKVKSITLKNIFTKEKIKKIDYLKIDCEGSEGLIIRSTPINILKKIQKISMEYHDNVSPINHLAIQEKLKKSGFTVKLSKLDKNFGYIYAWR